jgi:hypothetical protein
MVTGFSYTKFNYNLNKKATRFCGWLCIKSAFKLYKINTAVYKLGKFGTG